jgi:hypothetical protein
MGIQNYPYQNKGELSDYRIKRLDDIGFVWEKMFEALIDYKKNYGDCNVPGGRLENKKLATWVCEQRTNYRKGKLSKNQIKRLEDVGFVWELQKLKWEEKFDALKEYKKNHGDCNVPRRWKKNQQLANWVASQHARYRNKKLSEGRIKRLEDIGFELKPHRKERIIRLEDIGKWKICK